MLRPVLVVVGSEEVCHQRNHIVGVPGVALLPDVVLEVEVVSLHAVLQELQDLVHHTLIVQSLVYFLLCRLLLLSLFILFELLVHSGLLLLLLRLHGDLLDLPKNHLAEALEYHFALLEADEELEDRFLYLVVALIQQLVYEHQVLDVRLTIERATGLR
jgi:hypothetical protein